jgi:hypothetical protein
MTIEIAVRAVAAVLFAVVLGSLIYRRKTPDKKSSR